MLFGAVGAALWANMDPHEREATLAILENRYGLAVFVILACWVIIGFIVQALYRAYVLAPLSLREQALVMVNANPGLRLQAMGAPEIKALVKVVNVLAEQRESLQRDVEKVREAKASVEAEKPPCRAHVRAKPERGGVQPGRTHSSVQQPGAAPVPGAWGEDPVLSGRALIGLGRSIFAILDRNLITHALDNIQHRLRRGSAQPVANFVTTSQTDQLIRVQMAPVLGRQRTEAGEQEANASSTATC